MTTKLLILGANGFIGSALVSFLLRKSDWYITGMDIHTHRIASYLGSKKWTFQQGDMCQEKEWVTEQIKTHDIILPLAAIATPATYVNDPVRVFELDFEANLAIVRDCVKYGKRLIFPSTSEVYGMCPDEEFDEETSVFVTGPIEKERWIYASAKQMLDRLIYAYGKRAQLNYTLFRPFNWIGPGQDDIYNPAPGGSRVVTQFMGNILRGEPLLIAGSGEQKRCFTDIDDGLSALWIILNNAHQCAQNKIFNIGNPANHISIRSLASLLIELVRDFPGYQQHAEKAVLQFISGHACFGEGYQDMMNRKPSIKQAQYHLRWYPTVALEQSLHKIIRYYLNN